MEVDFISRKVDIFLRYVRSAVSYEGVDGLYLIKSIGCHELKFVVHLALLLGGSTKFLNHKSCSWGISTNIFTFFMHHWLQTSWINDKKYHHHREFSKLRPARNRVTNCPSARRAFSLEYSLEKYLGIGWGVGGQRFFYSLNQIYLVFNSLTPYVKTY